MFHIPIILMEPPPREIGGGGRDTDLEDGLDVDIDLDPILNRLAVRD